MLSPPTCSPNRFWESVKDNSHQRVEISGFCSSIFTVGSIRYAFEGGTRIARSVRFRQQFAHIDGSPWQRWCSLCRLHAKVNALVGSGRNTVVIFLHGFPEFWYSWRHQLEHFKNRYPCLALDMRGYGDSDAPARLEEYTIDKICLDIVGVMRAAGHNKCILVGHDWGGMIAWNFAANFPSLVDGLATLCSPHPQSYQDPRCFTLRQAQKSLYFLLFNTPWIPEMWLSHQNLRQVDVLMRKPPTGLVNKHRLSEYDFSIFRAALSRQGRLRAALNYYRCAMGIKTRSSERFTSRYGGVGWI